MNPFVDGAEVPQNASVFARASVPGLTLTASVTRQGETTSVTPQKLHASPPYLPQGVWQVSLGATDAGPVSVDLRIPVTRFGPRTVRTVRVRTSSSVDATVPSAPVIGSITYSEVPASSCLPDGGRLVRVHFTPSTDDSGIGAYVLNRVDGGGPATALGGVLPNRDLAEPSIVTAYLPLDVMQACFRVTALDIAGNPSESAEECVDLTGSPGGGDGPTGGAPDDGHGCETSRPGVTWPVGVLLAVALWWRRRRAARA